MAIAENLAEGRERLGARRDNGWLLPRDNRVSGSLRAFTVRSGFGVALADMRYVTDTEYCHGGGGYLKLQCKLGGRSAISGEDRDFEAVEPGRLSLLTQPADSLKFERAQVSTHERSVTLICSRDFASQVLPKSDNVPGSVRDFLKSQVSRFSYTSFLLSPQLRAIAEDILYPTVSPELAELMLEARSLELLYLALEQIMTAPGGDLPVRERDRKKILDLCALLEADPAAHLTISELAKATAWNETQMMECFKRVTGGTISAYRQRLRMDRARRQLHETDISVTEIALDAGYDHPSNFATAFRRTFGFSPRMARSRLS